jgi:hypothetical protein
LFDELGLDEILSGLEILTVVLVVLVDTIGLEVFVEAEEFELFKVLVAFDPLELEEIFGELFVEFKGKEEFEMFDDVDIFEDGGDITTTEVLDVFVDPEGTYLVVVLFKVEETFDDVLIFEEEEEEEEEEEFDLF